MGCVCGHCGEGSAIAVELAGPLRLPAGTKYHRVLEASPAFSNCVKMLRAESLIALDVPWPRCQDLHSSAFKLPVTDDFVFAVSHGWPFQTHPDPLGDCAAAVKDILQEALAVHKPQGDAVGFYDFTSVTQRPFLEGQAERTFEESQSFKDALACMPKIYLLADAVLHVDFEATPVPGDGDLLVLDASLLRGATLSQVGPHVQVSRCSSNSAIGPHPRNFDLVVGIDSTDVAEFLSVDLVSKATTGEGQVLIRRSPYGLPNHTPLDQRGWIYLERFISMVKVAMVDEAEAPRVIFSNSSKVVRQILDGGSLLRRAAKDGESVLQDTLATFFNVLASKTFVGASTDKLLTKDFHKSFEQAGDKVHGDRDLVARIMSDMVESLPCLWAGETARQRQRQLELAIDRGDAPACTALLSAGADVNHKRDGCVTALHVAARRLDLPVAQVLLHARADCSAQDVYGDCPAHYVPLFDTVDALQLFDLVTPSLEVLIKENVASVTPFERYVLWARTARNNEPYPPAQTRIRELHIMYPSLSAHLQRERAQVMRRKSALVGQPAPVSRKTLQCSVLGREISLTIWEPQRVRTTILWNIAIVASLCEDALDRVAQHLCERLSAKLVVLPLSHCVQISASTTWSDFCEGIAAVVAALPLPEKFILVEDCVATSCGWRLQHRLWGLLVINCSGIFDEEYIRSDSFRLWSTFINSIAQIHRDRDVQTLVSMTLRNTCVDITPELSDFCEAKWSAQSEKEWDFGAFLGQCRVNNDLSNELMNRELRDPPVEATVVVPALGSKVAVQNAGMILQRLLTHCELEFLPHSKLYWFLEVDAWVDIVLVLQKLLVRVKARAV